MSEVRVQTFDTTLRDGAQSLPEANQFPEGSKPDIADLIASLGVTVIEAGFPSTPGDFEEVKSVAQTVGRYSYDVANWDSVHGETGSRTQTPIIAGLSRTVADDIETTWSAIQDADFPRIHTFISNRSRAHGCKVPK